MPFLRTVLPLEVGKRSSNGGPMARQKCSYLYHQSEFQHNYFDFVSLHHSDHDSVVRIFIGHSELVKRLLIIYAAQFFLYQECNEKPPCRVANEVTGILTSIPGPTALHPLRKMRCELYQVKTPSRTHLLIFKGRAESTPRRERKSLSYGNGGIRTCNL